MYKKIAYLITFFIFLGIIFFVGVNNRKLNSIEEVVLDPIEMTDVEVLQTIFHEELDTQKTE